METQTTQALAAITDEGLFERIATTVLRLVPDYEGIAHTGINADGKTRRSPVDGLCFTGECGSSLIIAHHTTTAADRLERKWLLNPKSVKRRKDSKSAPEPGDIVKSIEILKAEREQVPTLVATLILATNQEPDEELIRKAVAAGREVGMTVDVWTRSRIADKLDNDPRGQYIRRKLLGIEAELLSRTLLEDLSETSLLEFDAGDDTELRVPRALDTTLVTLSKPLTFVVAPSGSGKTVACHKALERYRDAGGVAFILPHHAIEQAVTLEQAVMATLQQLHPSLVPGQSTFAFFSEEDPILILVEDISRSSQPGLLIERLAKWALKTKNNSDAHWVLLCPVWPHLLGGVRSHLQDRVTALALRPEPMSHSEAAHLVKVSASHAHISIDEHSARQFAAELGFDPLLIALNRDWTAPRADAVIKRFVEEELVRCELSGSFFATELHAAMLALGKTMLKRRALNPEWREVLDWGLAPEVVAAVKELAQQHQILRIDGHALDTRLRFRHDRVRDWLLVYSAHALETEDALTDAMLSDPPLAEIFGALLVQAGVPDTLLTRVQAHAPLALFHALRLAPINKASTYRIAEAAMEWLRDPENHGVATETLRWQAMAALEDVEGDYMSELIGLFGTSWPMGLVARLRNGDIEGGLALSAAYDLHLVVHWTRAALAAAGKIRSKMVTTLAGLLDRDDCSETKRHSALIGFAGVLGDPALAPALERLWSRDKSCAENLGGYLWAMARCATRETAAHLLDPVCEVWGALPQELGNSNLPSPRDELAAHSIRYGFEQAVPLSALEYFVQRAKQPDLSWQIEYMLHGVDHPTAILFEVEKSAERLGVSYDSYIVNNSARNHWEYGGRGLASPMSPISREMLLSLWSDPKLNQYRRRSAFDIWAASHGPDDLAILRDMASDHEIGEQILRQRLLRGDSLAIPALVERLDGEHGMRWWHYSRYVWSPALYDALNRALAREAIKPLTDENEQYEIGSTLTRPIMQLPPIEAETILLNYWDRFGETIHFVQAALFVGTPELLAKASNVIAASSQPAKLFEHFTMHWGIRMTGETGITREAQIRALLPYLDFLRPEDVRDIAEVCDNNGWYGLRREQIDLHLRYEDLAIPEKFRRELDLCIKHPTSAWIDHRIDDLHKSGISWTELAKILRSWLAVQPSLNALTVAKEAILHAGDIGDEKILQDWPGSDEELLAATTADLRFALGRRSLVVG